MSEAPGAKPPPKPVEDVRKGFGREMPQFNFQIKPEGRSLGLTARELGRQIRHAFYGAEALRQPRGREGDQHAGQHRADDGPGAHRVLDERAPVLGVLRREGRGRRPQDAGGRAGPGDRRALGTWPSRPLRSCSRACRR